MCKRGLVCLLVMPKYKPGDPAPEGYLQWHEWASVQHKAGLRQRWCPVCGKWFYPQEDCGHDKSKRLTQKQFKKLERKVAEQLKREGKTSDG